MKKKIMVLGIIVFLLPLFIKLSQIFADNLQPKPIPEDLIGYDPGSENDKKFWDEFVHGNQEEIHPLFIFQFIAAGSSEDVSENIEFVIKKSGINQSEENVKLLKDFAETLKWQWIYLSGVDRNPKHYGPLLKDNLKKLEGLSEEFFKKFSRKERVHLYCTIEWLYGASREMEQDKKPFSKVNKILPSDLNPKGIESLRKHFSRKNNKLAEDYADTVAFVRSRQYPDDLPWKQRDSYIKMRKSNRKNYLNNLKSFEWEK